MMSEVHQAEGDALDALGEVVDALGRTVRDVRPVPCGDLCSPLLDGPSEAANLDGFDSSAKSRMISATHWSASSGSLWAYV